MLAQSLRLAKQEHFNFVYKRGRRFRTQGIAIVYIKASPAPKVGIVVSKKVSPLATVRNYQRRRLWGVLEELRILLPQNLWLVFILDKTIKQLSYKQLLAVVEQVFIKVNFNKNA